VPYIEDPSEEPEREFDEEEVEARPRDPMIDVAKSAIAAFFEARRDGVFYGSQLEVIFEQQFFHWITIRALKELTDEGTLASELRILPDVGTIRFFRPKAHRYWRRQAAELMGLVQQFSAPAFTRALGEHGETMFDAALPTVGFLPTARKVRSYGGKSWSETGHDLDRVFERDGVAYGAEIKNTLSYISRDELRIKLGMCAHLGLRPLFIVRTAPKSYIELTRQQGGFTMVFRYQLYPFGQHEFARRVRETLTIPVDCPSRIADGTVQRFLKWHLSHPG
jgi:hypothetical protein